MFAYCKKLIHLKLGRGFTRQFLVTLKNTRKNFEYENTVIESSRNDVEEMRLKFLR